MQVIFLSDVKNMARRGDLKEVAEGYFTNFLAPKQLAVRPNDPAAAKLKTELATKAASEHSEIEASKKLAQSLAGKRIELTAKAKGNQPGDKLFGAIHEGQVADQLGIDKKLLKMTPLKTVGEHQVVLQLPQQQTARITVVVTAA